MRKQPDSLTDPVPVTMCMDARLHMESDRLAVISLYRQLGFEPLVEDNSEAEIWDRVLALLNQKQRPFTATC